MFLGKKPELWTLLRSRWRSRWSHGAQPGQQTECGLKTLGVRKRRMVKPTAVPAVLRVLRGGRDGVTAFRAPSASPKEEVGQIWSEASSRKWPEFAGRAREDRDAESGVSVRHSGMPTWTEELQEEKKPEGLWGQSLVGPWV